MLSRNLSPLRNFTFLKGLLYLAAVSLIIACNSASISNFKPVTNFNLPENKRFEVDMDSVIVRGIEAPTVKQVKSGVFTFSFDVNKWGSKKWFYKIYYQNEDYKFPEQKNGKMDSLCHENFYGAWGPVDLGFKQMPDNSGTVTDSFKIVGNPRNERKFFGEPMSTYSIEEGEVISMANSIKAQPEWYKMIEQKAQANKRTTEEQLFLDAIFSLATIRDEGKENHRWKRNPRMGRYSAMLVVTSENDLPIIPDYIQDVSLKFNDQYVNPFYYFLYGEGKNLKETTVILDTNFIQLYGKIDVAKGIFINRAEQQTPLKFTHLNETCNNTNKLFRSAHIEQFFHTEIKDYKLNTIPVIADVLANEYTIENYHAAEKQYTEAQMIKDYIRSSDCPCKTVALNNDGKYIEIYNPASKDLSTAKKENVGIKTRVGYTYGTFTGKIKFPHQINSTNVWTGLTNAFWMLFQDKPKWNNRRESRTGYTQKGTFAENAERFPTTYYSEIDFETVKTSQYWPKEVYPPGKAPEENAQLTDDVIVTCTNWDLCSKDPVRYNSGFTPTKYNNQTFLPFRWTPWYQATTIRTPVKNKDLYDPEFYYYQIQWKPNEIIWKIGPSKDNLKVVGYVNDSVTSIPNNQMIMIVTQEYHQSEWWPPIPFKQEYVPFLRSDLKGKVYEFEIE